jgi:peptide/nickel transport system permease protein
MTSYLIRRIIGSAAVLLAASLIVFVVLYLLPGDPARLMLGPLATAADLERLRHELGLDRPVYVQFLDWLSRVLRGDLGTSLSLHRPVADEIADRASATLLLASAALFLAVPVGIALGAVSAARAGSLTDRFVSLVSLVGLSIPSFWLGLMLVVLLTLNVHFFPSTGMFTPGQAGSPRDLLAHLALPAVTLAVAPIAVITRLTRTTMLETLGQEYVLVAHAKGLAERAVVARHVLRNAAVGIATVVGLQMGVLLGGAVFVERVFSWPGLGNMLVSAILNRDIPLVQGGVLLVCGIFVVLNLLTDLSYMYLDPRIRYG